MLVDKIPIIHYLPNATIVAKVTGTSAIPETLEKFMPNAPAYGFTDTELLKHWSSPFAIISGQKELKLIDDDDYVKEWMNNPADDKDDKGIFTREEEKVIIHG